MSGDRQSKQPLRVDPATAARFRASGAWSDVTIIEALQQRCREAPHKIAIIDGDMRMTFDALRIQAERMGQFLAQIGIRPGDVVSMQLPNWHEAIVLVLGAAMAGAIINPIVPIYRDAEVGFILRDAEAKALFIPTQFRNFDYAAMAGRLGASSIAVAVRGAGSGVMSLEGYGTSNEKPQTLEPRDAEAVRLLMYTSGTTGRAKGVLHNSNSLAAEITAVTDYWGVTQDDVVFMPSPLTHITGFLYGIELPVRTGASVVLMDKWAPDAAIDLIEQHGCTLTVGATPFLVELVAEAVKRKTHLPSMRLFACGGAPVPPKVIYDTHAALERCVATRVYGSTEAPTVTLGVPSRAEEKIAAETEGRIVGHEVKLLDASSNEVERGEEGEIVTRGPELFLGYLRDEDNAGAFTPGGYFRTGDLARLTPDGALTITGRKKDLIIRGGENIAPKEIEDVLMTHPGIIDAAVVAMPSARLGEGVCAFIIAQHAERLPSRDELLRHVAQSGLARQKWPEIFLFTDAFPRTAAGKVRKDLLRAEAIERVK